MSHDDDQHVSRREIRLIIATVREELRSLESRLTVKILIASFAASALGKVLGPSFAAVVAAMGAAGYGVKIAVAAFLHR